MFLNLFYISKFQQIKDVNTFHLGGADLANLQYKEQGNNTNHYMLKGKSCMILGKF